MDHLRANNLAWLEWRQVENGKQKAEGVAVDEGVPGHEKCVVWVGPSMAEALKAILQFKRMAKREGAGG